MTGEPSVQGQDHREIDVAKDADGVAQKGNKKTNKNLYAKQVFRMQEIIKELSSEDFDAEGTYNDLRDYIRNYDRILYSTVSHEVYDIEEELESDGKDNDPFATLLSNLDALRTYVDNAVVIKDEDESPEAKLNRDTKRAVWKLWDHINLAHRQFRELRLSEDDYKKRFEQHIYKVQADITKETNNQMLTIVGIFTALAFVVFGGISSLGSILSGIQEGQLLKLLIVSCVWGIGMLNVVFVFLFGIGKMTGKELKSNDSTRLRDKYPVYFWANYLLFAMIIALGWLYFSHNRQSFSWLDWAINLHPGIVGFAGLTIIVIFFLWLGIRLKKGRWLWWRA